MPLIWLTYSLSTLKSSQNEEDTNEITNNIINLLNTSNKQITLIWIPSCVGIYGNEIADLTEKQATSDNSIFTT